MKIVKNRDFSHR